MKAESGNYKGTKKTKRTAENKWFVAGKQRATTKLSSLVLRSSSGHLRDAMKKSNLDSTKTHLNVWRRVQSGINLRYLEAPKLTASANHQVAAG